MIKLHLDYVLICRYYDWSRLCIVFVLPVNKDIHLFDTASDISNGKTNPRRLHEETAKIEKAISEKITP